MAIMTWFTRTNDFRYGVITGDIEAVSRRENLIFGAKKLALSWLVSLITVLAPIVHFVLVPTFFFLGIYLFLGQQKKTHVARQGHFLCPACTGRTDLKAFRFQNEQRLSCAHCGIQLEIVSQKT